MAVSMFSLRIFANFTMLLCRINDVGYGKDRCPCRNESPIEAGIINNNHIGPIYTVKALRTHANSLP